MPYIVARVGLVGLGCALEFVDHMGLGTGLGLWLVFSRASCTLQDSTQVVTFLSVSDKKMSGRTEKVTLFNAFRQAGLTDLDEIWHDGRS